MDAQLQLVQFWSHPKSRWLPQASADVMFMLLSGDMRTIIKCLAFNLLIYYYIFKKYSFNNFVLLLCDKASQVFLLQTRLCWILQLSFRAENVQIGAFRKSDFLFLIFAKRYCSAFLSLTCKTKHVWRHSCGLLQCLLSFHRQNTNVREHEFKEKSRTFYPGLEKDKMFM